MVPFTVMVQIHFLALQLPTALEWYSSLPSHSPVDLISNTNPPLLTLSPFPIRPPNILHVFSYFEVSILTGLKNLVLICSALPCTR